MAEASRSSQWQTLQVVRNLCLALLDAGGPEEAEQRIAEIDALRRPWWWTAPGGIVASVCVSLQVTSSWRSALLTAVIATCLALLRPVIAIVTPPTRASSRSRWPSAGIFAEAAAAGLALGIGTSLGYVLAERVLGKSAGL